MKLRVERGALADAVAPVAKALPSRPSVPVLAGIKLTAGPSGLAVKGFDYEVSTQVIVDAQVSADGAALVSGRLLAEIVKALPHKPVDIAAVGAHLELVCGSARFTLPTMPVEDYPTLPDMPEQVGTVDAALWAAAVRQVAVAAGTDSALPMMTGIRVELNGTTMTMLATDRYRLAMREVAWQPADPGIDRAVLVPARTLADIAKTADGAGSIQLGLASQKLGEGLIGVTAGRQRTTSRLLDGAAYPPVRSLFPDTFNAQAQVPVSALTEVVRRVALVAERATPVRLSFSGDGLIVEAGGTEEARASEAMDATFTGQPLTIAFNPQYLLDGLAALNAPTAVLSFIDAFKPAVLSPADGDGEIVPGYRYLIMPIRVAR